MASDDFNRANETPLAAPWVKNGGNNINLASNVIGLTSATDTYYKYTGAATDADQYAEAVEVSPGVANHDWGPATRIGGSGHTTVPEGYFFDAYQWGGASSFTGNLAKHINGVFTNIASFDTRTGWAYGQVLRLESFGTTHTGLRDGTQIVQVTDSSITGVGQPGVFVFDVPAGAGGGIDDWSGGNLAATTSVSATYTLHVDATASVTVTAQGKIDATGAARATPSSPLDAIATVRAVASSPWDATGAATPPSVIGPNLATTSFQTFFNQTGIAQQWQRGSFTAAGRRWLFYADALDLNNQSFAAFTSSVDGASWESPTTFIDPLDLNNWGARYLNVHFDGSDVHYVAGFVGSDAELRYRRGTPNSDGTITWLAAEQVIFSGVTLLEVGITTDGAGHPFVSWEDFESQDFVTSPLPMVAWSTTTDGTWSHGSGSPMAFTSTAVDWWTSLEYLGDGKIAGFYWGVDRAYVRVWDGSSWGAEEEILAPGATWVNNTQSNFATAADSSTGRAFFLYGEESTPLVTVAIREPGGTWTTDILPGSDSGLFYNTTTFAAAFGTDGQLHLFLNDLDGGTSVHYWTRDGSGTWVQQSDIELFDVPRSGALQVSQPTYGDELIVASQVATSDGSSTPDDIYVTIIPVTTGGGTTPVSATYSMLLDAQQGIASTASSPFDAVQQLVKASSAPWDAFLQLALTSSAPWDAVLQLAAALSLPTDAQQGARTTISSPTDAQQGVANTVSSPLDEAQGLQAIVSAPYDAVLSVSLVVSSPWDSTGASATPISTTITVFYDALGGVVGIASSPTDAAQQLAIASSMPMDAVGGLLLAKSMPFDAQQGVARIVQTILDEPGGVGVSVSSPVDAYAQLVAAKTLPYETQLAVARALSAPFEALTGIVRALSSPWDATGTAAPTPTTRFPLGATIQARVTFAAVADHETSAKAAEVSPNFAGVLSREVQAELQAYETGQVVKPEPDRTSAVTGREVQADPTDTPSSVHIED